MASPVFFYEVPSLRSAAVQNVGRDKEEEHNRDHAIQREERRVHPAEVTGADDGVLVGEQRDAKNDANQGNHAESEGV